MEPIYLYPDFKEGNFVVTFGRSDELLCTPNGTVIRSENEQLIENLVFDLQKYFSDYLIILHKINFDQKLA